MTGVEWRLTSGLCVCVCVSVCVGSYVVHINYTKSRKKRLCLFSCQDELKETHLTEVQSSGMKKFTVNFCRLTAFTPVRQQLVGNVARYAIYFILVLAKMNKNLNQLQKCAVRASFLFSLLTGECHAPIEMLLCCVGYRLNTFALPDCAC